MYRVLAYTVDPSGTHATHVKLKKCSSNPDFQKGAAVLRAAQLIPLDEGLDLSQD